MKSNHRLFLNAAGFFCIFIVPLYVVLFSSIFEQINNFYISTALYDWLSMFVDKQIARGALNRLAGFIWGLIIFILWNRYIDHTPITESVLCRPRHKKLQHFAIGFLIQASIIITSLCIAFLIGNANISWASQNLIAILCYFVFGAIIISFNVFIEELIFRGYLLQKFALICNNNIACLLSTLLFMLAHPFHMLGLHGIIMQAGLMGLSLAYIAYYYNSIYVTFGIHLANNVLIRTLHSSKLFDLSAENHSSYNFMNIYQIVWFSLFLIFFIHNGLWKTKKLSI